MPTIATATDITISVPAAATVTIKRKPRESFESYAARCVAAVYPVPAGERRYSRVYREQCTRRFLRQLREAETKRAERAAKRARTTASASAEAAKRNADRVDGYDRDDTGLSPDL